MLLGHFQMEIHDRSSIWLSLYFSLTDCINSIKTSLGKVSFFFLFLLKNKQLLFIIVLILGVKIEYFEMPFFVFITREKATGAGPNTKHINKIKHYYLSIKCP